MKGAASRDTAPGRRTQPSNRRYLNGTSLYAPLRSGNPPNGSIVVGGGKETKHGIPLVAASETGKVQTESRRETCGRCRVKGPASSSLVKLKWPEKARHRG
jgi:hypothetical protein